MSLPTQKMLQDLLTYDPATGQLFWKLRPQIMFPDVRSWKTWNIRYADKPAFTAIDRKGYHVGAINSTSYRAARLVYKLCHGVDADQVDHIDGDRTNNKIANLRNVSGQQNQQNMKRCSRNTSGITGVSWNSERNRWEARITYNRKTISLGRFVDFEEATAARKEAEKQYGFHSNHGR